MNPKQTQTTPTHPLERTEVLTELWTDFKQLKQIYQEVNNKHRELTPQLKYLVYILQVRSQIGKSILFGLKDSDIDQMFRDLEEIKNKISEQQ